MQALRCDRCGGAVRVRPGQRLPSCLFCGMAMEHLQPFTPMFDTVPTEAAMFDLTAEQAQQRFAKWAKGLWFAPFAIQRAQVEVKPVYVPALRFSAQMLTHWLGLRVDSSTRSNRRPQWGTDEERVTDAFVVASEALTTKEIRSLGVFGETYVPFSPETAEIPWEVGQLSQRVAEQQGLEELNLRHQAILKDRYRLTQVNISSRSSDVDSQYVLVPVYVGVFYLRDQPWRVLINGNTGKVVGETLYSRIKIALVVSFFLLFLGGPCAPALALAIFFSLYGLGVVKD